MALIGIGEAAITDGTTYATATAYSNWSVGLDNGYYYLYTAECDPTDTDAEIASPAIPGQLVNGRKIVCTLGITTAGANVASGWQLEGSYDGKNWARVGSELSADITPDVAQYISVAADLSSYTYSWYRMTINDDVQDMTTIKFKYFVTGADQGVWRWTANGVENTVGMKIEGVGADPS